MATVRCPKGHMYDNAKYSSCPSCPAVKPLKGLETIAASSGGGGGVRPDNSVPADGMTKAVLPFGEVDPVVGWLVCTEGVNRGRDYRLHSESNKIGRSPAMDVFIEGDATISRDTHCQIVYSPRNKRFSITPGIGRNLVYVEGEELLGAMPLKPYHKIELGKSVFLFLPFCSDQFAWVQEDAEKKTDSDPAPKIERKGETSPGETI